MKGLQSTVEERVIKWSFFSQWDFHSILNSVYFPLLNCFNYLRSRAHFEREAEKFHVFPKISNCTSGFWADSFISGYWHSTASGQRSLRKLIPRFGLVCFCLCFLFSRKYLFQTQCCKLLIVLLLNIAVFSKMSSVWKTKRTARKQRHSVSEYQSVQISKNTKKLATD